MAKVGHLLGFVDLEVAFWFVAAAGALASLVAEPALGEALAVHLETVDFGALAAWVILAARGKVEFIDGTDDVVRRAAVVLVDEHVKEVAMGARVGVLLYFVVGDEMERAGRGGRASGVHSAI